MPDFVVFDLDGCLFNDAHRQHLAEAKQWDEYNHWHIRDIPCHAYYANAVSEMYQIIYCTGRSENHRVNTLKQLNACGYPVGSLLMRPEGDYRVSGEMKVFLLKEMLGDNLEEKIFVAFDNDDRILDHYMSVGIRAVKLLAKEPFPIEDIEIPTGFPVRETGEARPGADVPSILREAAALYTDRNPVYGNNYKNFEPLIKAMFPYGISQEMVLSNEFGIYMMMLVKMSRLAQGLKIDHLDSARDLMVYAAMLTELIMEGKE